MFHGIRDVTALPLDTLYRLAWRLPHYDGVMKDRAIGLARELEAQKQAQPASRQQAYPAPAPGSAVVPAIKAVLQADPLMAQVFSFG